MEQSLRTDLPVVDIAGTKFFANATIRQFIEVDDPSNRIHTIEMMCFDSHSEFLFDKKLKRAYDNNSDEIPISADVDYVWLRPIEAIDPQGMELLIASGQYRWAQHYKTPLPVIDIGGTDFYIDRIRGGFRQVDNRWNILLFSDTNHDEPWTTYFDKNVKNVPFSHELDRYNPPPIIPAHITLVSLPTGIEINRLLKDVITVRDKYLIERPEQQEMKTKHKKGKSI